MSTIKTKIIGAGSVGNHLAQASRRMGWDVSVVDIDPDALRRMKEEIYPKRYEKWDEEIKLYEAKDEPKGGFDVIYVGTPPDTHLPIAVKILREESPRVLQIEKPLCATTLEGLKEFLEETKKHPETMIIVGFDHILGENTLEAEKIISSGVLGKAETIDAESRSHWSGVFKAHPWLSGPQDTYLGFWQKGGGASGEHSHGLNLWQHFAHLVGAGRVKEVTANFDYVKDDKVWYDRFCFLTLTTENGLVGRVVQDVVTIPKKKFAMIQGEKGRLEWHCDVTKTLDRVRFLTKEDEKNIDIEKTRPDEFFQEIKHIQDLLDEKIKIEDSPVRLERGLDTMYVLNAAHRSFEEKKSIQVNYED